MKMTKKSPPLSYTPPNLRARMMNLTMTSPSKDAPADLANNKSARKRKRLIPLQRSSPELEEICERDYEVELGRLKEHITHLEAELARARQTQHDSNDFATILDNSGQDNALPDPNTLQEIDELHTSIENLNLGISQDQVPHQAESLFGVSNQQTLQAYLPSRSISAQLVYFALRQLSWIHCALHASDFLQQHDHFWSAIEAGDTTIFAQHSWLAIYFAVLAVRLKMQDIKLHLLS